MCLSVPLKTRAKIVVYNPFPIYPPISGGQCRVFHLYSHVAHYFDVVILCFADRRSRKMIAPGVEQLLIPKSLSHCQMELDLFRKIGFATCAILPRVAKLTPEYALIANEQSKDACIAILSHPYLYQEVAKISGSCILVYDAHNAEYELHRQLLPNSQSGVLTDIFQAEKAACEQSHLIATCSEEDALTLALLYNVCHAKFSIVPNGADTQVIPYITYEQRQLHKAVLRLTQPTIVYMGSNFPPNLLSGEKVFEIARQLPSARFLLIGSLCGAFTNRRLPGNVELVGIVTEQEKYHIFSQADVALNPALNGSGTNLKMLEYMAAGIPVVTTKLGARGISEDSGNYFIISECAKMPIAIQNLLDYPQLAADLSQRAYNLAKCRFDWEQIAANFVQKLTTLLE